MILKPAQRQVIYTALEGIPLIRARDRLSTTVLEAAEATGLKLASHDILVLAQKIVSKAEGRCVDLATVVPSKRAEELARICLKDPRLVEVILSESAAVIRCRPNILIVEHRLGFIVANAGVDMSNVDQNDGERVLLLPSDPDATSAQLKSEIDAALSIDIGVVINDSFGRPWRNGVVGVALGAAGIPALASMIGAPDLFGRAMRVTEVAYADELAAAASLLMGQCNEGLPVVHVRGAHWDRKSAPAATLVRHRELDLFR